MKIAICDDDENDLASLKEMIEEYEAESACISAYSSAGHLLADYKVGIRYDLVFLDIQMDGLAGFSLAELLFKSYNDEPTLIVFVTVTDKYVYSGYDVRAFGYFPKPVEKRRLFEKLDQAYEEYNQRIVTVNTGDGSHMIPAREIMYIESVGNDMVIHTDSNKYTMRMTMSEIKKSLPPRMFAQSHRSYIVNLSRVRQYENNVISFDDVGDTEVAYMSRALKDSFINALNEYLRR